MKSLTVIPAKESTFIYSNLTLSTNTGIQEYKLYSQKRAEHA